MSLAKFEDQKLIHRIEKAIRAGNISHAYIFEGDTCVDKESFAKEVVKAILCEEKPGLGCDTCITCRKVDHDNYEDLYIVKPELNAKKTIKALRVEDVENLQAKLKTKPNYDRNLAIICDADLMNPTAQNKLLKTLEEPTEGTVIFLLCENEENLLQTIRSRCISYHLDGFNEVDDVLANEVIDLIVDHSNFFDLKTSLEKGVKDREDAYVLLDGMERIYRDMLVGKDERSSYVVRERIFKAIELIEETRLSLKMNVNHSYALKNLVILLEE